MTIVLDCSLTMAWCFEDEASRHADRVLEALAEGDAIVPSIWALEVANVLLSAERHGRLTESDSARFLELLEDLPIRIEENDGAQAFQALLGCGRRFELSAYDASYLDLAMRSGAALATNDRKLRAACRRAGVEIFRAT